MIFFGLQNYIKIVEMQNEISKNMQNSFPFDNILI